jgi:hypothetical protein
MEGPEVPRESGGLGAFVLGQFGALHYRCIDSHGDAERERPVHVGAEVLQVAVVVHGGGDLRRRVVEDSLDRAEVDRRSSEWTTTSGAAGRVRSRTYGTEG